VAFHSIAFNLVPGDTNGDGDIFVHDLMSGQTQRVSVASDGTQGNGASSGTAISADGRFVAFYSQASNLAPGDTNGYGDIFVHDLMSGQTQRVSVASDGTESNGRSERPSFSAEGSFVAFSSWASNLVPDDTNNTSDVFVHDRVTGQTSRVSVASDRTQANGGCCPSISADGRFVAFDSGAGDLVPNDTNNKMDAFVHDRLTGQTIRVSVASDGTQGNGWSGISSISADGRFVAFSSLANNLVSGDTNGFYDIFVHDRVTGQTNRVNIASDGTQGNSWSNDPSISTDGRFVAFESPANNLVPGDTNGKGDIFIHDRVTGQTQRLSVASDGTEGNGLSLGFPPMSADGRYVAFLSDADNLVPGDTNGWRDVFVHDRSGGEAGPPVPFLNLPFAYTNFGEAAQGNLGGNGPGRVNSWFDHQYPYFTHPVDCSSPGTGLQHDDRLTNWGGELSAPPANVCNCTLGSTCYDGHNGIDFAYTGPQSEVRAAAGGMVTGTLGTCTVGDAGCGGGHGNYVLIDHENEYATRYGHLASVSVTQGTRVNAGDLLGIMGSTGRSTGTHLHFSLYYDNSGNDLWEENEVVDPFGWRGSPPEPWEGNGGPTSYYLWMYSLSYGLAVDGDQGAAMANSTGSVQTTIPPGAFSGRASLELSDSPRAAPSGQLRSTGRSFWLHLLEWLLESGDLQSAATLQSTTQFTLTKPITLTVTYTDTNVLHLDVNQLALYRWDEEQETWQLMTTTVDADNHMVTAQTEDLGDFDLQAPLLCATDDLEPDDGYAAARWVWANDWPLARGLDIPQDSDWVRFDAVQGVRDTVSTQNLAGGADTVLNLYDVDGLTLLASNDDADGGPASELVWTAPYTGTFFVETVSAPSGTTDCSATYELTIATIPGDVIANCLVDIADIMAVASRWRLSAANPDPDNDPTTPNYETLFDLDRDGEIDIVDIMLVAVHWGETCE